MGQPAGVTKCISSNPINNNVSVISSNSTEREDMKAINLRDILSTAPFYGTNLVQAGPSVASSGNLGYGRPFMQSKFGYQTAGNYVIKKITTTLAGVSNSVLQTGASDVTPGKKQNPARFYGYQRLNITSWNAVTGAATKGAAAGSTVLASGINGTTGQFADHGPGRFPAVPAELTYLGGSGVLTLTNDDYKVATNP